MEENVEKLQLDPATAIAKGRAMTITLLNARISMNTKEMKQKLQSVVDQYIDTIKMES